MVGTHRCRTRGPRKDRVDPDPEARGDLVDAIADRIDAEREAAKIMVNDARQAAQDANAEITDSYGKYRT